MVKQVNPKPDFVELEKKWLDYWYKNKIIDKYRKKNNNSTKYFSFLDGPITANNPMGVHHAWGRTYKDLWQRFFNMRGYRQRFQNGFDAQGLWVEVEVEKELGFKSKKDIEEYGIAKFVNKCKERVKKYAKIQTEQSKRLGYFMDWDNSYFTMSDDNNYMIWHFLKKCWESGLIYKGTDSVPWCPRCGTAISQHEILTEDYAQLTHESVFFKLKLQGKKNIYLLAWTTTPWTIPANVALAVNPDFIYGEWEREDKSERLIFFERAPKEYSVKISYSQILGEHRLKEYKKVKEYKGKDLIGEKYIAPFDNLKRVQDAKKENSRTFHTVVASTEFVTAEEGTAILHVAPGAGQEDFKLSKENKLPVIDVIDESANYLDGLGEFSFKNAKDNPELIISYLFKKDKERFLFRTQKITHRYPRCWRCKVELVWRVVDEWYIAMDKTGSKLKNLTLRERMIKVTKAINWIPEFGLDRELDWLQNMHDWLISKKRYWGLALPIYECFSCNTFELIGSKEELKERAADGWIDFAGHSPHRPWVDKVKIKCSKCGRLIERIKDVGNPWLDAGIVPYSTISKDNKSTPLYKINKNNWRKWFPTDFITESFPGQFKNWFYSLIAMSTVLENERPFKTVLGFGTLLAEDGRPMHKSWGNSIEFNEGADKIGVDVMRWMYVTADPKKNLLFGYKRADQTRRQFHLLLWNIYSFFALYATQDQWKPNNHSFVDLELLDKWILSRLNNVLKIVTESLNNYNAMRASLAFEKLVQDISRWYVRRSRSRVGLLIKDKKNKNAFYSTMYNLLVILSKGLAPFIPFLAEEIFTSLTGEESVHLSNWPDVNDKLIDNKLENKMQLVREIVEKGHAIRKEKRIKVRQPLRKFKIKSSKSKVFKESDFESLIKDELNVKEIEWVEGKGQLRVEFDTKLTQKLKEEGEAREIIRQIQIARKKAGCSLDERIRVRLPSWPKRFEGEIIQKTLASKLIIGEKLEILSSST